MIISIFQSEIVNYNLQVISVVSVNTLNLCVLIAEQTAALNSGNVSSGKAEVVGGQYLHPAQSHEGRHDDLDPQFHLELPKEMNWIYCQ